MSSLAMLRTERLAKSFTLHLQGGLHLPVLSGVDLEVHAGECVVLAGPSGAGKSTLLRSLYGNYRADGGRIMLRHAGEWLDLAAADPRTVLAVRRETLGYVSQFLRVVPRVAALEIVAEALTARGVALEAARERARTTLLRLNVPERLHGLPPASLDAQNRAVVIDLVTEAKQRGAAILAIAHDEETRAGIASRVFAVPLQAAAA